MRKLFYDPKTNGFLDLAIHGEAACKGLKPVSAEEHARLMAGQAQGKVIVPGKNKLPLLAETAQALDAAAIAALRRAKRDRALAASDWTQLPDVPLSSEQKAAWATYRQQLRDLTADAPWPTAPTEGASA